MSFDSALATFARALGDPRAPIPDFTRGGAGVPDAKRFAVYRNNVAVGLIGALEARFPVTRRLVGEDFFRAMARAFVLAAKPQTPVLIHYGAGFPEFVARFPPAEGLPYLADVARLEDAWVDAYHAAEAPALTLADLAGVEPERLPSLAFAVHPAARLLDFAHPAASIWAAHQGDQPPRAPSQWRAEPTLITRPEADVVVRVLPPGGFAFASALCVGVSLGEAAAQFDEDDNDPVAHLIGLVEAGAFARLG